MALLLQNAIPDIVPDGSDPNLTRDFLTALKLVVEEMVSKVQSTQEEIRTDAPGVNDVAENEFVRATVGGNHYIYTQKDGVIYRWQIT